jgi:hypothetical protein
MDALYPEPPHLSIAVWSPEDEESVFGRASDVAVEFGCVPAGVVELAPRGRRFAMVQDLGDRVIGRRSADEFESAVHGGDAKLRPVKAGYRRKGMGTVVVEHLLGTETEPHPVAVSLSADALGTPEELWNAKERKAARKLADWATDVLRELTARTGAAYGAIGVEESLPTPSALRSGASIGTLPFISAAIGPAVLDRCQAAFGPQHRVDWPHGAFFTGWQPFAGGDPVAVDHRALTAASIALGTAAK